MNHLLRTIKKICVITLPAFITGWVVMNAGCNKKFDAPPLESADTPAVTMTIKDLKALHTARGGFDIVNTDAVISGIVTANDSSGNFYQEIVIQDNTGAIPVEIQANSLYATFPVGRKIFIKAKGLTLGDYSGSIQLGGGVYTNPNTGSKSVDGILSSLVDNYIVRGSFHNVVMPLHISDLSLIDTSMQSPQSSILVMLDSFEFADHDLGATYADSSKAKANVYFNIENCSGQTIELYNSSYAGFASFKVPQGRGVITGIYTKFSSTKELLIRDTSDVKFYGPRCNGNNGGGTAVAKTIAEIRAMYTKDMQLDNYTVGGTVISDTGNTSKGSFVIQSGNSGISVYAGGTVNYKVGDSVTLNLTSQDSLMKFNNSLELKLHYGFTLPAAQTATTAIAPAVKTIAQINTALASALNDPGNFEYTLVQIKSAAVASSGNYSGSHDISDGGSDKITLYTKGTAGFAGDPLPSGNQDWTGYAYNYSATVKEFSIRSLNDVSASGGTTPPTGSDFTATYDFSSVATTTGTTDPTTPPTVSNATFGSFSAVGVSANSTAGSRFSFTGWPTGATNTSDVFSGAISTSQYFEVTITPASGHSIDLSGITFTFQRSGTGVRQASVRSSIDNFTGNLPASIDPANTNLSVVSPNVFQIIDGSNAQDGSTITLDSDFNNITSAVTFRFYGFNAEAGGGSFSLDNVVFSGKVN